MHVSFKLSAVLEPGGEATNGHVGNSVEVVEIDAEVAFQFALVVGFKVGLVGRQEGAIGIVNEVEDKAGSTTEVPGNWNQRRRRPAER